MKVLRVAIPLNLRNQKRKRNTGQGQSLEVGRLRNIEGQSQKKNIGQGQGVTAEDLDHTVKKNIEKGHGR